MKSAALVTGLKQMTDIQKGHVPLHIAERESSALDYLQIEDNDRWPIVAHIRSRSRKGKKHTLKVHRNGQCECPCEDFVYRHAKYRPHIKDGVVCDHLGEWRQTLLTEYETRFGSHIRAERGIR